MQRDKFYVQISQLSGESETHKYVVAVCLVTEFMPEIKSNSLFNKFLQKFRQEPQ